MKDDDVDADLCAYTGNLPSLPCGCRVPVTGSGALDLAKALLGGQSPQRDEQ